MPIGHLPAVIQVRYIVLSTRTTELGEGNVRSLGPCILTLLLLASFGAPVSAEQQAGLLRKHHPWGTFEPGRGSGSARSPRRSASGRMSSTTDAKTTLKEVGPDGVTLQIQVNVEVGGKRSDAPPETIKQGFDNELANSGAIVRELGPGQVTIQGRDRLPDSAVGTDRRDGQDDLQSLLPETARALHPSPGDPQDRRRGKEPERDGLRGDALDVPYSVLGEILNTAHIKIVHKNAEGTTTTLARLDGRAGRRDLSHPQRDRQPGRLTPPRIAGVSRLRPDSERERLFHRRASRVRKWQRGGN